MSAAGQPEGRKKKQKKERRTGIAGLIELVVIVGVALGMALLIQAFIVKPYKIPSESMVPTLEVGQRVLVNRLAMQFGSPKVGQVAVFHPPVGAGNQEGTEQCGDPNKAPDQACDRPVDRPQSEYFIKRVVAGPGDTIFIRDGHVIRNGKREKDDFTRPCDGGSGCNLTRPITIPPGHWFMMGDNRGQSDDSRFWGPVPKAWIIGPAFATYWPPDRIGGV